MSNRSPVVSRRFAALVGALLSSLALPVGIASASPVVYSNLDVTNQTAAASRPDSPGAFEIETADDFILTKNTSIDHATFIGLLPDARSLSLITQVRLEIYRVFPKDSDTTRLPSVPTRVNSPSDVALADRSSTGTDLTFSTTTLSPRFVALNSVQPGGIHPSPGQITGGNGSVTGVEVQFDVDLLTPFLLPADHYFFIPQVQLSDGTFYWLSASRPISGSGSTPFAPDLQAWTRDARLDPDWLRIGTDIVGGTPAPTFNAAFALNGTVIPEPAPLALLALGLVAACAVRGRRAR